MRLTLLLAVVGCGNRRHDEAVRPAAAHQPAEPLPGVTASAPGQDPPAGSPTVPPLSGSDAQEPPQQTFGGGARPATFPGVVRLAVLGDYGNSGSAEQQVAELVQTLGADYVVTTGDNNYPSGSALTIDQNIGQYYSDWIHPYRGRYVSTATENRFFPVLGNHDWVAPGAAPYLDYFTLPGNERYYQVVLGNVELFAVDSDSNEPDGVDAASVQGRWLQRALASSRAAFQVVAMHHPPYSSGPHGSSGWMQWPYAAWGADLVLAGHDHCYERLSIDGVTYVVSGLGGASIYSFGSPVDGSQVRYNEQYGATVLDVDAESLRLSFFDLEGRRIDSTTLRARWTVDAQ